MINVCALAYLEIADTTVLNFISFEIIVLIKK